MLGGGLEAITNDVARPVASVAAIELLSVPSVGVIVQVMGRFGTTLPLASRASTTSGDVIGNCSKASCPLPLMLVSFWAERRPQPRVKAANKVRIITFLLWLHFCESFVTKVSSFIVLKVMKLLKLNALNDVPCDMIA